jgi:hypothetical protein
VSDANRRMLFCPIHGDYGQPESGSQCPICAEDPIRSQASLRAVKVITTSEVPHADSDDQPTSIDDAAPCPSCGKLTPLSKFQTEAIGEVWEGEAALWAEEGVCSACYRNEIPGKSSTWSTEDWLAHHFEGWNAQVRRVAEIVEYGTSEQDSWLPEDQRPRILDVEQTLASRREHLARAQMRLREIKGELEVEELPERFEVALRSARRALDQRAVLRLKERAEDDLKAEKERRIDSVAAMSPFAALEAAGLDPEKLLADGSDRGRDSEPASTDVEPQGYDQGRWPLIVIAVALLAFVIWWFVGR